MIAGPIGAGKTTLYDAHLKEAFPSVVPPIPQQRDAMLRERRSFVVEDLTVDTELLESARQAGYTRDKNHDKSTRLNNIPKSAAAGVTKGRVSACWPWNLFNPP